MPELICAASDRDLWLTARRAGITATDIVTILGLSSWDSPYSLFWRKLGQVPEIPDSDRFRLSRELEDYTAARWGEDHPDESYELFSHLYRSSVRPWQIATPDAVILDSQGVTTAAEAMRGARRTGVLEVKTWADADRHSWDDSPPPAVRAQVLWQMDVMDVPAGHVGVMFLPSGEFRSYEIKHEPTYAGNEWGCNGDTCQLCADLALMRAAGDEFMHQMAGELPPPDPDESAATLAAVRARFAPRKGKRGTVDAGLWQAWLDHKHALDEIGKLARGREIEIREQLGECDEIEVDGELVGRRVISDAQVKTYTRHQDYIKRINRKDNGDEW